MTSFASHLERNTLHAVLGKVGGQRENRHTSQKAITPSRREWSMAKIRIRAVSCFLFFCFFSHSQYIWKIQPTWLDRLNMWNAEGKKKELSKILNCNTHSDWSAALVLFSDWCQVYWIQRFIKHHVYLALRKDAGLRINVEFMTLVLQRSTDSHSNFWNF